MKRIINILKVSLIILTVLSLSVTFGGCKKDRGALKIGLSFSDFSTERWPVEAAQMTALANEKGVQVVSQVANHDVKLQNDQIENMVLQGVDVIVIIAEDGDACATAVETAVKAKIPCIAYDRLIKTDKLAAYISFDNVEVGRQQADGVLKVRDKGRFVMLGGSPTDNNAKLFRKGQMEKIQPLVDSGDITIVADKWVDNWERSNASKIMENILASQNNKIDAIIASNDATALGAIDALKMVGSDGKIPISGQDATAAGCKAIVEGELTMTVFKDVRLLTPIAIEMAIKLAKREKIEDLVNYDLSSLTLDDSLSGQVPCKFLPVVQVDKTNLYEIVIKSGSQKYDEVYRDVPADMRPPRI